jgi:hypothetical protein
MRELTELEFDILNVLYFVEPFEKILEEVDSPANVVADSLKFLIDQKLVVPMRWDDESQNYLRSFIYDTDDMNAYRYLATKEGLILHNSR